MLDTWKLAISIIHRSKNRVNPSPNHWFSQRTTSNAGSCVCFCRSLDFSSCSWGWYIMHPPAPWNLNMGIALAAHFQHRNGPMGTHPYMKLAHQCWWLGHGLFKIPAAIFQDVIVSKKPGKSLILMINHAFPYQNCHDLGSYHIFKHTPHMYIHIYIYRYRYTYKYNKYIYTKYR